MLDSSQAVRLSGLITAFLLTLNANSFEVPQQQKADPEPKPRALPSIPSQGPRGCVFRVVP